MKCVKKAIKFDGINFTFNDLVVGKVPKDMIGRPIPKSEMQSMKEQIFHEVCKGCV